MNRYQEVFNTLKKRGEIAFIPFAVAGDPDIETSRKVLMSYIKGGADILEIGFPFSDPVADGPVNQRGAQRAIANGLNYQTFFSMIKGLRQETDIPIGLLLYANSLYYLGYEEFCHQASEAGIDSILVADMPPEESDELRKYLKKYSIGCVYIISELTPPERISYICKHIDSFVYVVSRLGATGVDSPVNESIGELISRIKKYTDKPLAVGFGISRPEHVEKIVESGADGAIVGSALVKIIESASGEGTDPSFDLQTQVRAFKNATKPVALRNQ
ncbi:tryptophan synthase subunit alpha [Chitinispirillales bacterium ANBcel5]|uniref:tryptophan synthase subunit alpha n=1 Tax=Cellulosispirillum alkaliphilum TaxID=3039283 RepID=UPI002A592935|nr:tryptophan synthase subunit alpha [Chitinispirillales bacterium ANBcel5]